MSCRDLWRHILRSRGPEAELFSGARVSILKQWRVKFRYKSAGIDEGTFKEFVIGSVVLALSASAATCQEPSPLSSKNNIEAAFKAEVEPLDLCPRQFVLTRYPALGTLLEQDGLIERSTSGTRLTDAGRNKLPNGICFGNYKLVSIDEVKEVYSTSAMTEGRYLDYVEVKATYTLTDREMWTQDPRYLEAAAILKDGATKKGFFRLFLRDGAWSCKSGDGRGYCVN